MISSATQIKMKRPLPITQIMGVAIRLEVLRAISVYMDTLEENIPVWTGRLRRSLYPLGERLVDEGARKGIFSQGSPQPTESARRFFARNNKFGGIDDVWHDRTSFRLPRRGTKAQFTFKFASAVPYYGINDNLTSNMVSSRNGAKLKNPTPWKSQEKAMAALQMAVLQQVPSRVAQVLPIIVGTALSGEFRGNSVKYENPANLNLL